MFGLRGLGCAACAVIGGLMAGCASPPAASVASASAVPPPRVMAVITEQGPGHPEGETALETAAIPLLIGRKVPTVDPGTVQANRKSIQALLAQSGDDQGATEAGVLYGADVILSGRAEARCLASQIAGSQLKSYQATVTLRAIHADDATVLATASETAAAIALDDAGGSAKAIQLAGSKALERIIPDLLLAWNQRPPSGPKKPRDSLSVSAMLAEDPAAADSPVPIDPPPAGYEAPVAALWALTPQGGVSSNTIPVITDTLYATLLKSQWFRLVTREDMARILGEHKLQMSDLCDSSERAVEYGKILNAQKMVIGTAGRLGNTYQVVLKLVDVETGEIERAGQAEGNGAVNVLMPLVRKAAADLLNKKGTVPAAPAVAPAPASASAAQAGQ